MFFRGYTKKQWRMEPADLDKSVCGRIPIRTNRDDRYLREPFQALPLEGYTAMFNQMLDSMHGDVSIELGTSWQEVSEHVNYRWLAYTGPVDRYFDDCYGALPYRSLNFEHQSYSREQLREREAVSGQPGFWQPTMQVNYGDEAVPYTRTVEIKHATQQKTDHSTVVTEFPRDFTPDSEPYYPVPFAESQELYRKYKLLSDAEAGVSFVGRLATYKYYNMDQVVGMSLHEADKIANQLRTLAPFRTAGEKAA